MRARTRLRHAALAATVVGVLGVAGAPARGATTSGMAAAAARATATVARGMRLGSAERVWIGRTLARMTLSERVGQLFEINGYGDSVNDPTPAMVALNRRYYGVSTIAQLIRRYHPGGIIYFDWSNGLGSPQRVRTLSNGIQRAALAEGARLPMVISADQEGGEVVRFGPPVTVMPGNMPLGATMSAAEASVAGRVTGVELRAVGVNVDNAPVVDVNVDPLNQADGIRAYGDRPGLVSTLGAAQIAGMQAQQSRTGVGATAKHWPGFGDAPVNSDTGVAVSGQTLAQVKSANLPPFAAAIRAGVDRIMVTHILFPKITGSHIPTSLSPYWVDGLLRGTLHYGGPVVTDALDAAALHGFTPAQVALRALGAGDDELLEVAQTPTDTAPADLVTAYPAVLGAVRSGAISELRLDESVARILALKWKLGIVAHPLTPASRTRTIGTPAHRAVAQRIADRSITLLRNRAGLLPLHVTRGEKVLVAGFGSSTTATLGQDLAADGLQPLVIDTGFAPTSAQIAQAVSAARQRALVIVDTFNGWEARSQFTLVNALIATGTPVVVAAVGTPYDVAYLPKAETFLTSFGYQPPSLQALVRVMVGKLRPAGRLPVTITAPPPSTKVLYPFGYGPSLP
ncbi:MAG TPA: glycoside hydrolase family 3 N-terminal domain-containing protein [Solirubrobacteraceae bacterium]|nr:glycoside hydrolase family 3 N-terminal domain-containing protein [Solirubrobacteraceae bacterium]